MKKIVLKVNIVCKKSRACILATVGTLCGIKSMELDEEKCTLTVVGDVDPVLVVQVLRRAKKCAVIVSVGPDKEPANKPKKKPEDCIPCGTCRPVAFGDVAWYDAQPVGCTIL